MGLNFGRVRPADAITVIFVSLFALLTVIYYGSIASAGKLLVTYISLLFLQLILIRYSPEQGFLKFFHDIVFPVMAVFLVFNSMTELVPGVNPGDIDFRLIRADYWLLGGYPTVWLERVVNPYLTEILQLAYTSYYFLPVILGIALKIKKRETEFDEGLLFILLCFYLSYVGYILFPALGPRYTMNHLQSIPLKGTMLSEKIYSILNSIEGIKRDAFPSGHTAVTLVVLHLAYRYEKRLFYIYLPITVLLVFATVYCRYHYVVDVLGGIVLYVITMIAGQWILRSFRKFS
ncbi:phosphoesterase, PA-phosphatase related [hydrothermal vent metagenome]|uniref:Phosphoesterase, PA-phosphatase related n=1 Tax=hydrothermal vent metagenome TaxID=652676 RepID=A0A3B1D9A2_9ZZZZ